MAREAILTSPDTWKEGVMLQQVIGRLAREMFTLLLFLVASFAIADLLWRAFNQPAPVDVALVMVSAVAVVVAVTLRAHIAGWLVTGFAAWHVTILFTRAVYGSQWARPEAQFAAMIAGVVGALLGILLVRSSKTMKMQST